MQFRTLLAAAIAATLSLSISQNAFSQALPTPEPLTPPEAKMANAINRWTSRVVTLGQAANDNDVRREIASQVERSSGTKGASPALPRTAPWLAKMGRILGPVGVGFSVYYAASNLFVSSDGEYVNVQEWRTGPKQPPRLGFATGSYSAGEDSVLGNLGQNGAITYSDTGNTFRSEWSTAQNLTEQGKAKYGPNWQHRWSKINQPVAQLGVDAEGKPINLYGHVFQYVGTSPSRPYQIPYTPTLSPEGQTELAKLPDTATIAPETLVDALTETAKLARAHATQNSLPQVVPDPAVYPPTVGDFLEPWTGADLKSIGAADRPVSFGEPDTGTNPNPNPNPSPSGNVAISNWGDFQDPGFSLPALEVPSIPSVPELIETLANPLRALIPVPPAGSVSCPAIPWFMGQEVTQHCGAIDQLQPWLGNLAKLFANIAAFFIVIRR